MREIELSVQLEHQDSANDLLPFLKQFEAQHNVHVRVKALDWSEAWQELVQTAIRRQGPDISSVGSTWVASLAGMDALRPIAPRELQSLGDASAFSPGVWKSGLAVGSSEIWAIPWSGYARLIYYRRDWLERAGINARTAFRSPGDLLRTLQTMARAYSGLGADGQAKGTPAIWHVARTGDTDTLHNIASWIWQAGGDFLDASGRKALFHQPAAMAGLRSYFELFQYLSRGETSPASETTLFHQGKIAMCVAGPGMWLSKVDPGDRIAQEAVQNMGAALPLGAPFVGASHLVIWKHSRNPDLALELIRFLTGELVQKDYIPSIGLLPARQGILSAAYPASDPISLVMEQALYNGRSFPAISKWGIVEERLVAALKNILEAVQAVEQPDIDAILEAHLLPLGQRLELTLSHV